MMKTKIFIPKTFEEIEISFPVYFKRHCTYFCFQSPSNKIEVAIYDNGKSIICDDDNNEKLLEELVFEERQENKNGADAFYITEVEFNTKFEWLMNFILERRKK